MKGLSPKIPLVRDSIDGFSLTKEYDEMIQQNFKNLVLTSPGERIMDPDFGVGIRQYLFELKNNSTFTNIEERIVSQASIYLPFIEIVNIEFGQDQIDLDSDENGLLIRIEYFVIPHGTYSALEVPIDLI